MADSEVILRVTNDDFGVLLRGFDLTETARINRILIPPSPCIASRNREKHGNPAAPSIRTRDYLANRIGDARLMLAHVVSVLITASQIVVGFSVNSDRSDDLKWRAIMLGKTAGRGDLATWSKQRLKKVSTLPQVFIGLSRGAAYSEDEAATVVERTELRA
jgi:hypothetical protein